MDSGICLALLMYFEARSEPVAGQLAVAHVALNRVKDKRWPNTVCAVMKQHKQFSFYSDGKSDNPYDKKAWRKSQMIADLVLSNQVSDFTQGSDHYHTKDVKPIWSTKLTKQMVIGNHIFYK